MNKRKLGSFVLCAMLLALSASAEAQQPTRNYRVGILGPEAKERKERIAKYLHELGYIEGTNVTYEVRGVGGEPEPRRERIYANFAAELVRLKVDVIVAGGAGAVSAAKKASATIPIVMGAVNDPIALGFVESLAHPGGSITGISSLSPELSGKRLELVKGSYSQSDSGSGSRFQRRLPADQHQSDRRRRPLSSYPTSAPGDNRGGST